MFHQWPLILHLFWIKHNIPQPENRHFTNISQLVTFIFSKDIPLKRSNILRPRGNSIECNEQLFAISKTEFQEWFNQWELPCINMLLQKEINCGYDMCYSHRFIERVLLLFLLFFIKPRIIRKSHKGEELSVTDSR